MNKSIIYKRLYKDYSKKYLNKIILSAFFSILVAGSTSAIAWLLDPAIKKLLLLKMLRHFSGYSELNDLIWKPKRCIIGKTKNKKYIKLKFKR